MSGTPPAPVAKLPLILLGIMTILSFGGPFGILWILSGGSSKGWPPDRPVEWVAFVGVVGLVAAFMVTLLALGISNVRSTRSELEARKSREGGGT